MSSFRDYINEVSNYKDGFGNPDAEKLYQDIIKDIVNVDKNFAVMYRAGRLDVLPKNAQDGDLESGTALAKKLLPKIQKSVIPFNISAELTDLKRGPRHTRLNKPLHGAITFIWN